MSDLKQKKDILGELGKNIAQFVRDDSIEELNNILTGKVRAPMLVRLSEKVRQLDEDTLKLIETLSVFLIDNSINNFLWMIEEKEEFDLIGYTDPEKDSFISLRDASDGLSVDYWNFVDDFSKFKRLDDEK